jgi:hypothetical protein
MHNLPAKSFLGGQKALDNMGRAWKSEESRNRSPN